MNRTRVIFTNELIATIKRKGFLITTISIPALAILGLLVYQLVTQVIQPKSETEIKRIGYVDQTGVFEKYATQGQYELVPYSDPEQAKNEMLGGMIREYFVIPEDYINTGLISRYSLKTELEPPADVINITRSFLLSNLLDNKVSSEVLNRVKAPLALTTTVLDKTGSPTEGQGATWLISYLFSILLIMSIFTASGYLLQGLSEEKENRVMEILLSSVSTRQLITGKVLALGVSGLLQMVFWLASAWGLLNLASGSIGGFFTSVHFPANVVVLGLLYYILGYFLFAVFLAGIGAIAPTQRDGQQMSVVVTLLGSVPYFLMPFIIENGEHIVSKILTIFPFTAPLTVMMRLAAGIPVWELIVSVAVLILTIYGGLLLVARVFRIFLLMYGKAPGWKEVFRSLRQA